MTNANTNYGIETSTMVIEFNASVWTARALDKKVTEEVTSDKLASKQAGRFNKNLMAGRTELAEIQTIVGSARNYIYQWSAPWSDAGQRWIPTARLLAIDQRLSDYKAEFDAKVEAFLQTYPSLITGQAMAMGNMFNRSDYPSATDIRRRFDFNYTFLPVPSTSDFRVAIPADAQHELKERLQNALERRVEAAVEDVQARLVEHLTRMSVRLVSDTDPKTGEAKSKRFHDTLVSGAFDLCDLVADFNVTGDKKLSDARTRLEAALSGVTTETLRTDEDQRDGLKKEVDGILNSWNF